MLKKLQEERMVAITKAREILDAADEEKRSLTSEERELYDSFDGEIDRIDGEIQEVMGDARRRNKLASQEERADEGEPRSVPAEQPTKLFGDDDTEQRSGTASREYNDAWWKAMRHTRSSLEASEFRALQVGTNSEGGYLVPDEFFSNELTQALEEANVMRQLCRVIQTNSGTLEIPVVSGHGAAAWTAEEAAFSDADETFSQVTLASYKAGSILKVSDELLRDSAFDLSAYLAQEMGRRLGRLEEAAFVNGDGSSKPTGAVQGSTAGKTAASNSAITADEVIDLFHALGRQYRQSATFLMKDSTLAAIRKLKDGDSQYLWQPGLQAGEPGQILGRPVQTSDSVPAIAADAKVILFGDFSYYWVADREAPSVKRLEDLYAANGQVGFRIHKRVDGKVILAEAIQHLVMAS
tara:strand:- start:29243 stop:30472 length:1230 start_codon:yes stop_codon:yes gene_type:complete